TYILPDEYPPISSLRNGIKEFQVLNDSPSCLFRYSSIYDSVSFFKSTPSFRVLEYLNRSCDKSSVICEINSSALPLTSSFKSSKSYSKYLLNSTASLRSLTPLANGSKRSLMSGIYVNSGTLSATIAYDGICPFLSTYSSIKRYVWRSMALTNDSSVRPYLANVLKSSACIALFIISSPLLLAITLHLS